VVEGRDPKAATRYPTTAIIKETEGSEVIIYKVFISQHKKSASFLRHPVR